MRAHTKGLELIYDVQPDVPDALVGDAGRLRQVLLNLVGNAIKFTDAGEVVVRVEVAGAAAPEGEVGLRFTVRDTGIGIPRDQQERIFRAFEQEDSSTTRRYGGTGLGLTIAARLVALMGGADHRGERAGPGQHLRLHGAVRAAAAPTGAGPCPAAGLAPQPAGARRRRQRHQPPHPGGVAARLADGAGGGRRRAGGPGRPLARRQRCGRPYALVLLDARMPDTDGLALAAKIRKRAELAATRIILLTSGDRPGDCGPVPRAADRRPPAQAGPAGRAARDDLPGDEPGQRRRPAGGRAHGGREPAAAPVPAATHLHILVAEDNEFNAQLLERLLARRGHRVRLANNGREALALAAEGGFDLLLLDVHMPELDGFQVVQAVRERERSAGGICPSSP